MFTGLGLSASAGIGLLAYALFYEPRNIEMERRTLYVPQAAHRLPADGLRILHLSDSHFQDRNWREQPKIERIRRLTAGLEYDLLVHTGDFIHYDHGLRNALALLDAVPQPRLGTYAVLGNHDYTHYAMQEALPRMWRTYAAQHGAGAHLPKWMLPWHLLSFVDYVRNTPLDGRRTGVNDRDTLTVTLEAHGVSLLHNRAVRLIDAERGLDLWLAGVDDVTEGQPHLGAALAGIDASEPVVLLSHNPDILDSRHMRQVDVVLAGHTHGGQIVLPLWGPAHTQSWHLARHEVAGFFHRGRTQVYISRGIGEGIPLRFLARPQIALITLLPGEPGAAANASALSLADRSRR